MTLKYVIFDEVFPVLFGPYFKHDEVRAGEKPTSAGFCSIATDGGVVVYGKSESLNLSPADGDAAIILSALE